MAELRSEAPLQTVTLDREAGWARLIFAQQARRLETFLERSRRYEFELASGRNAAALEVLDTIERDFGTSLWLIENRIAVLQLAHGLDKQKAYLSAIRSKATNVVSFIAFYISNRNEETISPARFSERLRKQLEKWDVELGLQSYLRFRIANEDPADDAAVAAVLRHDTSSALVDHYDTFIRLAQAAALHGTPASRSRFMVELQRLTRVLSDPRIEKVLFLLGGMTQRPSIFPGRDLSPAASVAKGKFDGFGQALESARLTDPADSTLWFLEAQLAVDGHVPLVVEDGSIRARTINAAAAIITRTDTCDDAVLTLGRLAANFTLTSFAKEIPLFLAHQVSSEPVPHPEAMLRAFLESQYLDPRILSALPSRDLQKQYADALVEVYGTPPVVQAEIARADLADLGGALEADWEEGLSSVMRVDIEGERLLRRGSFVEASEKAKDLRHAPTLTMRRRGARLEAFCLLKDGRLDESIDLVVATSIDDPGAIRMLPIGVCGKAMTKEVRRRLAAKLSTSILLDLYSRYVDDGLDNLRAYAYEDFLIANGLERPRQLAQNVQLYDRAQLIYYLRYLCIPPIMQISSAFLGTKDVEEERLQISSLLAKINPINEEIYEAEIRDIKRKQLIERGVRHVEQSKIFADFNAIKRWAERELKESFARYQTLLRAGIGGEEAAFTKAIYDALGGGAPLPKEFLELPKNEAIDLLFTIVYLLFRECAVNPEYGLDCYLSMRIRHGTLSGQLRSPLEQEGIITQRNEIGEYGTNSHWLGRLAHLDWQARARIDATLQKFSREYDGFIDRIANDLVQIKSKDKKHGMFEIFDETSGYYLVGINAIQFRFFAGKITPETTFDEFLEHCFRLFWGSVEPCLAKFRTAVDEALKPQVNALFAQLQDVLSHVSYPGAMVDLDRAVRTAQTGAQQALDRVKEWFRPPQPTAIPDFSFEELVDVGLQCVRTIHPEFSPSVAVDAPVLPAMRALTLFSDIFFIVFDNIRRHSGILSNPRVSIGVSRGDSRLSVRIQSEVAPGARTSAADETVARIKRSIAAGDYHRAVRSEGGTGLIKLRRIIGQLPFDFGFLDDSAFFVSFDLVALDIGVQEVGR